MSPLRVLILALSLSSALFVPHEDTYDLIWRPKSDDTLDYRLSLQFDIEEYSLHYDTDIHMKVLKVKDNGDYELETSTKNTKVKFGDDDEVSTDEEPEPTVETFNARGQKIGAEKDVPDDEDDTPNPVGKILGEVTEFSAPVAPVKKGDRWSHDIAADEKQKVDAARLDYEVIGTEGSGEDQTVRIDFTYKEVGGSDKPVTANGVYRLKRSDFSMSAFEASVENFKMDDEAPAGKAQLEMKRQLQ